MGKPIKIEVFMSLTCSSEPQLRENIEKALSLEGVSAEVVFQRLTPEEAERLGLKGSPTVRINGEEIQPLPQGGFT
ncbi:MAG: thioredoxin family protein [Caldimicrobium sp.]